MITGSQIRMARHHLRWTAKKLAAKAGVGVSTVQRMESVDGFPQSNAPNLKAVRRALEEAGVEFIDENGGGPGVRASRKNS